MSAERIEQNEPYEVKLGERSEGSFAPGNDVPEDDDEAVPESNEDVHENDFNCKIKDLSDSKYKQIVKDLTNGVRYKYFKLKYFKNGKVQLVYNKAPTKLQTITEKSKQKASEQNISDKAYLTDQQLMWMQFVDMNREIEKLRHKNKKRKQQVAEIGNDIYYVEDEDEDEGEKPGDEKLGSKAPAEGFEKPIQKPMEQKPRTNARYNDWRSRIKYLH
jgi:hypothetical protein